MQTVARVQFQYSSYVRAQPRNGEQCQSLGCSMLIGSFPTVIITGLLEVSYAEGVYYQMSMRISSMPAMKA